MSDPLSREAVAAVDPADMAGDILDLPHQALDALRRAESASLGDLDAPGGLVVCGMGGSAVGGDLAAAVLGDRLSRPLRVTRGYTLPVGTGADTLVLGASYSGETEETLAAFEAAGEAGGPRAALTTGGRVGELARAAGAPVIGVPSGMQPRAAVAYMTVGTLACAAACGAGPSTGSEVEKAVELLDTLARDWGPDSAPDSQAKRLARELHGRVPVIYGAGPTAAVAGRWKTQVNENAGRPAFAAELPEAAHNDVCAWEHPGELAAVFLEDAALPGRLTRQMELMREMIGESGAPAAGAESHGSTPFERVMSLVLLGDLVSLYLAVLDGVDPTPVPALDRLKSQLA